MEIESNDTNIFVHEIPAIQAHFVFKSLGSLKSAVQFAKQNQSKSKPFDLATNTFLPSFLMFCNELVWFSQKYIFAKHICINFAISSCVLLYIIIIYSCAFYNLHVRTMHNVFLFTKRYKQIKSLLFCSFRDLILMKITPAISLLIS